MPPASNCAPPPRMENGRRADKALALDRQPVSARTLAMSAPVIVRIAGLAAERIKPFGSTLCNDCLAETVDIRAQLDAARHDLAQAIEATLSSFGKSTRARLLAIKRDCFNCREIKEPLGREFDAVGSAGQGAWLQVLTLQVDLEERHTRFEQIYQQELAREREVLASVLKEASLLRGLSINNPLLASKAREASPCKGSFQHQRGRKLEQSLLRYATRTACKLSPNSTLTATALGVIRDLPDYLAFQWRVIPRRERSLLRIDRTIINPYLFCLLQNDSIRSISLVRFNSTIQSQGNHRVCFFRPGGYIFENGNVGYRPTSKISVRLTDPLSSGLAEILKEHDLRYAELVQQLQEQTGIGEHWSEADIKQGIESLIDIGILVLLPPWPTNTPYIEPQLLNTLRRLPRDPLISKLTFSLREILTIERNFQKNQQPEIAIAQLQTICSTFIEQIQQTAGLSPLPKKVRFYEDIALTPRNVSTTGAELIELSTTTAGCILKTAELLNSFCAVFNHRHEFLHALAAWWIEQYGVRRSVPALELFYHVRELWKQYLEFEVSHRFEEFAIFDPFELPAISHLYQMRIDLHRQVMGLMQETAEGYRLPAASFGSILGQVPCRYKPLLGCSLFVQPADPTGNLWVVNRLFEGTGRYLTRYTANMQEKTRRLFTEHFRLRSSLPVQGRVTHLLDLLYSSGSTSNLRFPQTRKVLVLPDENVPVAPEQRVTLAGLTVHFDAIGEEFYLTDMSNTRLLPVHMSSTNYVFLPSVLKFLSMFGPAETRQIFPRPPVDNRQNFCIKSRVVCDNLVLRRKRWEVSEDFGVRPNASDATIYAQFHRWRCEAGLPREVYVYEKMGQPESVLCSFKPQFIDFSSPLLVRLFYSIATRQNGQLIIEEALPDRSAFPLDSEGFPRAIEFVVDSLALGESVAGSSELSEPGSRHLWEINDLQKGVQDG